LDIQFIYVPIMTSFNYIASTYLSIIGEVLLTETLI